MRRRWRESSISFFSSEKDKLKSEIFSVRKNPVFIFVLLQKISFHFFRHFSFRIGKRMIVVFYIRFAKFNLCTY